MKVVEIIESRRWKNVNTGATASTYGAVPWVSESERLEWAIETIGWTWRMSNGTVGLCRVPAKTYEEAVEVMEKFNNRAWR